MEQQDDVQQAASGVVDQTKEVAGRVLDQVVDQTKGLADRVSEGTRQTTSTVADRVVETVMDKARRQAASLLEGQKDDAVAVLEAAARALLLTGQQLRTQERESIAQTTYEAAQYLDRLRIYLDSNDVNAIVDDVERVAARIPAMAMAGAFAVGLFGARLRDGPDR